MTEESVFAAALAITNPDQRAAYLDRACTGNADLRRQVEELLAAHAEDNPLDRLPVDLASTGAYDPPAEQPGALVGAYKLLQQIGEGGMGIVFMAEQQKPVRRKVALKIIKPGMDSQQVVARFEAERQALSMMDHPNIAKVFDADTTTSGRPFFVMELIHGVPLTDFCDANKLATRERLELFAAVCQAIQHAHQKGIIHRDIKPSNILVTMYDDKPVPKVIDFGVAKAIEQRLTERTMFTQFGALLGTFEYMSPEQAEMNAFGVDTRSDVYSLGVLLYELLTGTTPLERQRLRMAALDQVVRLIKQEEPPRPRVRLSTSGLLAKVAAARRTEPAKLSALVRGDLDWIAMRCLEKDRSRRYDSASALARDVERYLHDEPVEACPPTLGYRLRKLYRRNRAAVLMAGAFAVVLLAATGVSTTFGVFARRAEREAEHRRQDAADALRTAKANENRAVQAGEELRTAHDELWATLHISRARLIQNAWDTNDVSRVRELLRVQVPTAGERDLRNLEWHYFDHLAHAELSVRPPEPAYSNPAHGGKYGIQYQLSPDATYLAVYVPADQADAKRTGVIGRVDIRNALTGRLRHAISVSRPPGGHANPARAMVQFTADGSAVSVWEPAVGRSAKAEPVASHWWLFDAATGRERLPRRDLPVGVYAPIVSPDGTLMAAIAGSPKGEAPVRVNLFEAATLKPVRTFETDLPNSWYGCEFRPGGRHVAMLVDLPTKEGRDALMKMMPLQKDRVSTLKIWDVKTGREAISLPSRGQPTSRGVLSFGYTPDGKRLIVLDPKLRVLDADTGRELFTVPVPAEYSSLVASDRDGSRLVLSDRYSPYRAIIDTVTGQVRTRLKYPVGFNDAIEFSADGTRVVTLSPNGTVRVWDATVNELPVLLEGKRPNQRELQEGHQLSADGRFEASAAPRRKKNGQGFSDGLTVSVFETANKRKIRSYSLSGWYKALLHFSPDNTRLVGLLMAPIWSPNSPIPNTLKVWDLRTGAEILSHELREWGQASCEFTALSPDGRRLACAGRTGEVGAQVGVVRIVDVASGKVTVTLDETPFSVMALTFSPDSSRLAVAFSAGRAGRGREVGLWDPATGHKLVDLATTMSQPDLLEFTPDGHQLNAFGSRTTDVPGKGWVRTWLVSTFDATPRAVGRSR